MLKSFPVFSLRALTLALCVVFGAGAAYAQSRLYVANSLTDSVSVIDPATSTVTATVAVGDNPIDVAATPDGAFVYVANLGSDSVSVISTATNTVVATVPDIPLPIYVAITPDGAAAYVSTNTPNVLVIDTATNTVTATIPLPGTDYAGGVGITPNGAFAWVGAAGAMFVIDTATNTVAATISVPGAFFKDVVVSPDGAVAYGADSDKFRRFDTATNSLIDTFGIPAQGFAVTPDGAFVYIAGGSFAAVVIVFDPAVENVTAFVPTGPSPYFIAITADGAVAYTPLFESDAVAAIDTATNTLIATIPLAPGSGALGIAIVTPPPAPTNKDQCKNGGWQNFTNPSFQSQGECIKYVNSLP